MSTQLWIPPTSERTLRSWQPFLAQQLRSARPGQWLMWWAMRHATDLGHLARCHVRVESVVPHSLVCSYSPQNDLESASLVLCGIEAGHRHFFSRGPLSAGLGESGGVVPVDWERLFESYSLRALGPPSGPEALRAT